ncbi:magnesium transporter CorA family protein [Glaciimonas sp. CA11.2]|uniref:magnesium transporter CorA family protein n=1 Tax=unclassified Glaciimonas TaxID=2644401 RepID=UPI002AB45C12|nr:MULTISPECIES: magnesium transporter CorA family protein [unclassified Glaciimonas]MDY7545763.1 magnesium transporter CorA family protein [Glaciimonas sp. CA11.2]MEB0011589.1 magnesium transporter CorA family protein [Glaciimonas sp. Cout2]MEB0081386.1 magnesium transporter CorA family protein [Glaciimonas sp. Gout2]MEB0162163.1 magnesium transporter CorA family protein [Glaciimonas sp. CA11.2]
MDIFLIGDNQVTQTSELPDSVPPQGFLWIDTTHEEVAADPEGWRDLIACATGTQIYDPHLKDAINPAHPSYFDSTQDYGMVVFRKLSLHGNDNGSRNIDTAAVAAEEPDNPTTAIGSKRPLPAAFGNLTTQPITFFILENALVTVHEHHSRTISATRSRLLDYANKSNKAQHTNRLPTSPEDLMLRLLNAMVDKYLELRQPLTTQLDRWQRALLDPARPFKDWLTLLDARIELRKLESLCEEQHDAMQELRDYFVDMDDEGDGVTISRTRDLLLVRINDVMEHITRVLNHASRLESSIESAVQIHFSAVAHRTNEVMRTLTVITALFMPLTLITGIFGMNFAVMPLLQNKTGFWLTMISMVLIVVGMLAFFRRRRYLENPPSERH